MSNRTLAAGRAGANYLRTAPLSAAYHPSILLAIGQRPFAEMRTKIDVIGEGLASVETLAAMTCCKLAAMQSQMRLQHANERPQHSCSS